MKYLGFVLALVVGFSQIVYGVTFSHSAIQKHVLDRPLVVEIESSEEDPDIEYRVFYRLSDRDLYSEVVMQSIGNRMFRAEFMPEVSVGDRLSYYIEGVKSRERVYTLPEVNPSAFPYRVEVLESQFSVKMKVLLPLAKKPVRESRPTLLVSFKDDANVLNMSTLQLRLNGRNVTSKSNITDRFVSFVPLRPLREGRHELIVSVKDHDGHVYQKVRKFEFRRVDPPLIGIKGQLNWDSFYYNTTKLSSTVVREPSETKLKTNVNFDVGFLKANLYSLMDSRDSDFKQPYSRQRIRVHDSHKLVNVVVGDTNPVLSPLSFNGRLVKGVDASLDLFGVIGWKNFMTLRYFSGQSMQTVKVSSPDVTNGTYQQDVRGVQLGFNVGISESSLNYLHFKDDESSLVSPNIGSTKPKENHVVSLVSELKFARDMRLKLEAAGSVYYSDTQAATINVDELGLGLDNETLDQLTDVFPPRSSLSVGAAGLLDFKMPILSRDYMLFAKSNWVHPSFTSLGNSGLKKDNFDWKVGTRLRFLKNLLSLRASYKHQFNNVFFSVDETTFTDTYRVNGALNIPHLASFSLGYQQANKIKKDLAGMEVTGAGRLENSLNGVSFGVGGIKLKWNDFKARVNSNYSISQFDDKVLTDNSFDLKTLGMNVQTTWSPVKLKLGLSQSIKDSKGATPNTTTYTSLSGKAYYDVLPKLVTVYVGSKLTTGLNNGSLVSKQLDNQRSKWSVGAIYRLDEWEYFKRIKLIANLDLLSVSDAKDKEDGAKNFEDSLMTIKLSSHF